MSQNGRVKYLCVVVFLVGLFLCVFPFLSNEFVKNKQVDESVGVLEIPSIDVRLPIYPDVKEEMLQYGVGHIKSSHLPGGGKNTHSLIAGHRGLPRASLLVRLGEVKVGEHFFITMGEEVYQYCVTEICVIRPEDTACLKVQDGRELVSIITCTPLGIHTHRLVVTGERIH